jgi:hypothetical protein
VHRTATLWNSTPGRKKRFYVGFCRVGSNYFSNSIVRSFPIAYRALFQILSFFIVDLSVYQYVACSKNGFPRNVDVL